MSEPSYPRDLVRATLSVLAIIGLLAGSLWVMRPFLAPLLWAGTIVVATWPALRLLEARMSGHRALAVVIMTCGLLLVVVVPLYLAVTTVIHHAHDIGALATALASPRIPMPPAWLEKLPVAGVGLAERWQHLASDPSALSAMLTPYLGAAGRWFAAEAGDVGATLFQFLVTVAFAAILYSGGESTAEYLRRFLRRLAGASGESAVALAAKAIQAVALGVIVTAILEATLAGISLAVTGVPAVGLLSAIVLILGIGQIGVLPVLVPAVIWLYWSGSPVRGTVLLVCTGAIGPSRGSCGRSSSGGGPTSRSCSCWPG